MTARILIVDDRVENLIALEAILDELDADFVRALSGEEALTCLLDQEVALILMDVQMPKLNGFETAALIRGRRDLQHVPIIFVTAISRDQKQVFQGYESGAVDYLFKPLDPYVTVSKVRVFLDIYRSRQQIKEQNAALQQQNELLRLFAGAASHDLKAPLRSISSFSRLLVDRLGDELDPTAAEYLGFLVSSANRMQALIDDLLEYSDLRHGSESAAPVALNEVLRDATEDLAAQIRESGASLDVAALPEVTGRPHQLRSLFENLIGNALKYRSDAPPKIEISCERSGSRWIISVKDNGLGIQAEYHNEIFEPFRRLHGKDDYEGTGIGLALCARIVRKHRGDIRCDSDGAGCGSTFIISLPAD